MKTPYLKTPLCVLLSVILSMCRARKIQDLAPYLAETEHLDFRHPVFDRVLAEVTEAGISLPQKMEALFYFVRDSLPFAAGDEDVSFKASEVLTKRRGFCYLKAMVYVAFCRKLGVPARLALERFYIRAHLPDAFHHYHGIAAVWYGGRWIYMDTVSNRDSWHNFWAKKKAAPFKPPVFQLDDHVSIDSAYIAELKFEDYETNDLPSLWLKHIRDYLETGKWPD
ncbi:MAG: transglutaminase family protein [Candidatus Aminicenantes bacterium]|nr:transglutaminase family protein [Candidatus Aminicenantes bacterium]